MFRKPLVTLVVCYLFASAVCAQSAYVQPYLQAVTTQTAVIMWETDTGDSTELHWGLSPEVSNSSVGISETTTGSARLHSVSLKNLLPATKYYYKARTMSWESDVYDFITPAEQQDEQNVRIIAMSDMQKDGGNPLKFQQVVHNGIMDYVDTVYEGSLNEEIGLVIIPGDLVDNGLSWSQWRNDFFGQSHPLFSQVPVYPVPGNHEFNAAQFFQYFNLPNNGTSGYEEHWWYKDYSNVRVLGMDSNVSYRIQAQLDWLDQVLLETCNDTTIDFVFVQLHHPFKSELWLAGELDYTGTIVSRLEQFSSDCGKPSIHFFGHTHGYSRGQSRDHSHLWVNVATAGGHIDYWGEYAQNDYDEFVISQDEYGFVIVEVTAGDDPSFRLKRISIGDEFQDKSNTLEDELEVRLHNLDPVKPLALFPSTGDTLAPDCIEFVADTFIDPDGDGHSASHWQIAADSSDFDNPLYDTWRQDKNWYFDINTQEGDNLKDETFQMLPENTDLWWRVRYRDSGLKWSGWSDAVQFHTGPSLAGENLVINGGAENGTGDWVLDVGAIESLSAGECNGINPHTGSKYFAVGALCDEYPFASVHQDIDISDNSEAIDSGLLNAVFGAQMADWNGSDVPALALQFLDAGLGVLGGTDTISHQGSWAFYQQQAAIPAATRHLRLILMGTRNGGVDNDCYFDEVFCRLQSADSCLTYLPPGSIHHRLYVRTDAPGYPNGESWDKAFKTLSDALHAADSLNEIREIWVSAGVYQPTTGVDRNATFTVRPGLKVYGGFTGNENTLGERDPDLNPTVLSGDIGVQGDSSDNSFHIMTIAGSSDSIFIDGFIIEKGYADGVSGNGSAVFIESTPGVQIQFNNMIFRSNFASIGGAFYNTAMTRIENSLFQNNLATEKSNSILNSGGVLELSNIVITNNCTSCNEEITNTQGGQILQYGTIDLSRE